MSTAYHPLVQRAMDNLPESDERFEFRFMPPGTDEELYARNGWFAVTDLKNNLGVEVFPQNETGIISVYANWHDDDVMLAKPLGEKDETLVYKGPYQGLPDTWKPILYPHHRALVLIALGLNVKRLLN